MEATGTGARRLAKCLVASVAVLCMIRAEGSGRVREGETTDQQKMAASWIAALPDTTGTGPLPIFRRAFGIPERVRKATLRISGLGQYEVHLNGRQVTDAVMNPAWSDYRKRIYYNTYDVTQLVRLGKTPLGCCSAMGCTTSWRQEDAIRNSAARGASRNWSLNSMLNSRMTKS